MGSLLAIAYSAFAFASPAVTTPIKGDYVEARTASVFAGACHYNGEVVTTGRDAVMAWKINSGTWKGTSLAGVQAVAILTADSNLGDEKTARRAEIIVDDAATEAQAAALVEALKTKYSAVLGELKSVRRAPLSFKHEARSYHVEAAGTAALSIEAMPNDECCKMPNLIWYAPLVPLVGRKVGYTAKALVIDSQVGEKWERGGENSAFYGDFSL
jgi:hypothetical protein